MRLSIISCAASFLCVLPPATARAPKLQPLTYVAMSDALVPGEWSDQRIGYTGCINNEPLGKVPPTLGERFDSIVGKKERSKYFVSLWNMEWDSKRHCPVVWFLFIDVEKLAPPKPGQTPQNPPTSPI